MGTVASEPSHLALTEAASGVPYLPGCNASDGRGGQSVQVAHGPFPGVEVFDSPEAAALAEWSPAAGARLVSVEVRGDVAEVLIHVRPDYPDYVMCLRTTDGWIAGSSGNGHVVDWDSVT